MDSIDQLEPVLARFREKNGNAISLLQDTQNVLGYIPEKTVGWLAEQTGIPESKLYGIVTFYSQFYMKPRGKTVITACCGTVCHVKGSQRIISRLNRELKLKEGQDTTRDGQFTLEKVNCIGACSMAPVVLVNDEVNAMMTPDKMVRKLNKLNKLNKPDRLEKTEGQS